jgi:DnaJ-like protein
MADGEAQIDAYPLAWPAGWPRTRRPEPTRFRVSLAAARDDLLRELDLMRATGVVVTSNALLLRDGRIAARQPRIDDAGAAVYFAVGGEPRCIPCDRWDRIEGNIRAIGLTVAALRGLERWGAGEMVRAAFRGFAALPASGTSGETDQPWWSVLGVAPDASETEIDAAYRRLAREHHPDAGGDAARFRVIADAHRQAKEGRP